MARQKEVGSSFGPNATVPDQCANHISHDAFALNHRVASMPSTRPTHDFDLYRLRPPHHLLARCQRPKHWSRRCAGPRSRCCSTTRTTAGAAASASSSTWRTSSTRTPRPHRGLDRSDLFNLRLFWSDTLSLVDVPAGNLAHYQQVYQERGQLLLQHRPLPGPAAEHPRRPGDAPGGLRPRPRRHPRRRRRGRGRRRRRRVHGRRRRSASAALVAPTAPSCRRPTPASLCVTPRWSASRPRFWRALPYQICAVLLQLWAHGASLAEGVGGHPVCRRRFLCGPRRSRRATPLAPPPPESRGCLARQGRAGAAPS